MTVTEVVTRLRVSSKALAKEDTLRRGVAEEPTGPTAVTPYGSTGRFIASTHVEEFHAHQSQ